MSNTHKDREFLDLADAFINLANQQCATIEKGKVSAAFLYAAARFNTYLVATSAPDVEQFKESQPGAQEYFLQEYKKMLVEHMGDYEHHFAQYVAAARGNGSLN